MEGRREEEEEELSVRGTTPKLLLPLLADIVDVVVPCNGGSGSALLLLLADVLTPAVFVS